MDAARGDPDGHARQFAWDLFEGDRDEAHRPWAPPARPRDPSAITGERIVVPSFPCAVGPPVDWAALLADLEPWDPIAKYNLLSRSAPTPTSASAAD